MAKLTVNEAAQSGLTHAFKFTFEDLQAIGNGGQETLFTKKAGQFVELAVVKEEVAFAGTTSLVIDVGTTGADPDEYINALDVDAMTVAVANTGDAFTTGYTQAVDAAAADEAVVLEVTDANIASATAGEVLIGFRVIDTNVSA
jgi:hypothetical protein